MLTRKMKIASLVLISALSFGCSSNNGINMPVLQNDNISESGFNTKVAAGSQVQQNQDKPKPPAKNENCEKDQKPSAQAKGGNVPPPPPPKMNDGKQPQPNGSPRPLPSGSPSGPAPEANSNLPKYTVTISGGYETNPVDKGRPVILIASALGVTEEVFRYAFSFVTPAAGGQEPDPAQVNLNKAALLKVLGDYGITNDMLDTVSNYYRYSGSAGQVWARTPATATAIVTDGVVTGINITNAGAGYTSAPTITISGTNVIAKATLAFTKDFKTNGSISSITLN